MAGIIETYLEPSPAGKRKRGDKEMAEQIGARTAMVSSGELGLRCWLPKRFIPESRCDRVWRCKYPEKATCQAVHSEIAYLNQEKKRLAAVSINIDRRVEELAAMLEN